MNLLIYKITVFNKNHVNYGGLVSELKNKQKKINTSFYLLSFQKANKCTSVCLLFICLCFVVSEACSVEVTKVQSK